MGEDKKVNKKSPAPPSGYRLMRPHEKPDWRRGDKCWIEYAKAWEFCLIEGDTAIKDMKDLKTNFIRPLKKPAKFQPAPNIYYAQKKHVGTKHK